MRRNILSFLALVFTALALIPYGAHLFALPNKIGMTEAQYFTAQSVYQGWALLGLGPFSAVLINLVFATALRRERPAFYLAAAACICMATTLAVFCVWTYPANVATQNWTVATANWAELRQQWEYSHAINAGLSFVAFCFIALASITSRR